MLFSVLVGVASLAAPQIESPEPVQSPVYHQTTEVRTTATATRTVVPDLAVMRFEFTSRDTTPSAAARAGGVTGEAIRKAIVGVGVPADSILGRGSLSYPADQMLGMDVKPNHEFKSYDTTYVLRDVMEVRVRDLKRVAGVIDAALGAGVQKMVFLQFSSSRVQQAGQEALEEATRQARRNAELMARASGGRLGRPLELTTEKSVSGDPFYDIRSSHSTTPVSYNSKAAPPGAEVRVSVYGRWELLAGVNSVPQKQ